MAEGSIDDPAFPCNLACCHGPTGLCYLGGGVLSSAAFCQPGLNCFVYAGTLLVFLSNPQQLMLGNFSSAQCGACACRLRLPSGTVGRDYVLLQLQLGNRGPFDFMVRQGEQSMSICFSLGWLGLVR